jgi:hypothetical protein
VKPRVQALSTRAYENMDGVAMGDTFRKVKAYSELLKDDITIASSFVLHPITKEEAIENHPI